MRPTRVIVDLEIIQHNIRNLRKKADDSVLFMAIVKANAYGHGLVEVSRCALDAGAAFLGVSIPEEGAVLREAGISAPILVLGGISKDQSKISLKYNLTQTVSSIASAVALNNEAVGLNTIADVHMKLDTGMGPIGLRHNDDIKQFINAVSELKNLKISGVFTHFALADGPDSDYTLKQIDTFKSMISYISSLGIYPKHIHASNSAAIIRFPDAHFNMVRGGISIYGYYPSDIFNADDIALTPALKWVTQIVHIKTIQMGSSVSYGRDYIADKERNIATLPVGYGDGYMRLLSNKGYVLINGKKAPILGRVCMDQVMVDITDIGDAAIGDEAVLLGKQGSEFISADDLADMCNTISYEILTNINSRVPRVYINGYANES